jgi:ACS family tartrate transporter-like MFS transporter
VSTTSGTEALKPFRTELETRTIRKLFWRLLPFLFLLYVVSYLDRINVGFAKLQMQGQLELNERVFGVGFGIFFAGYFFFQVPSNLLLERVGVRRWIAGLMILWGLVSCSMIFIRGPVSFYVLRFLLGAAEAGFFPGMILYMKNWFPSSARARAVAWFMTANPLAGVIGSPISGVFLTLHSGPFAGWQWLFILEAFPAIVLGFVVYWVLPEKPNTATWLSTEERSWLLEKLSQESSNEAGLAKNELLAALGSLRIWILALVYFGLPTCMYGVTLWLPSAIHSLSGLGYVGTGVIATLPFLATTIAMVLAGMHSDHTRERTWHTGLAAFAGVAGLLTAAYGHEPVVVISGMTLGMMGAQSMAGPFWAMATVQIGGRAAAGIAVINSVANLGGYLGPYVIGLFRSTNGQFRGGLLVIGAVMAISGTLALLVGAKSQRIQSALGP